MTIQDRYIFSEFVYKISPLLIVVSLFLGVQTIGFTTKVKKCYHGFDCFIFFKNIDSGSSISLDSG